MDNTQNLVSLAMLAEEFGFHKSRLTYYVDKGLLKRVATIGRMGVFNGDESRLILKEITKLKTKGLSLEEIEKQLSSK